MCSLFDGVKTARYSIQKTRKIVRTIVQGASGEKILRIVERGIYTPPRCQAQAGRINILRRFADRKQVGKLCGRQCERKVGHGTAPFRPKEGWFTQNEMQNAKKLFQTVAVTGKKNTFDNKKTRRPAVFILVFLHMAFDGRFDTSS